MDTSKFDSEISSIEARLEAMKPPMVAIVRQFVSQVQAVVNLWVSKKVKDAVREQPERASAYGKDGIEAIKRDIAALEAQSLELIEGLLLKDNLWTHRKEKVGYSYEEDRNYRTFGKRLPDDFDSIVRVALGYAGQILEKHKFTGAEFYKTWSRRYDREGGAPFKYEYSFDCPPELISKLTEYADASKSYAEELEKLRAVKKRKSEAEVDDLWG